MKIAILVSGTYRETDFLLDVLPQIADGIDYDIYLVLRHTTTEVSRLGTKEVDFKLPQGRNNVFMCELPGMDKEEVKSRYLIQVGPTDPNRECAILSMFQGVFTSISMMKASLRKYDYVMKTRTDYLPSMTISEMVETNKKTGKIIVDGCANWNRRYPDRFDILWQGSLNDIFCFAPIGDFLKLWDFESIMQKVWTGIPETTLFRVAMIRFLGDELQSPRRNDSFLKKYFTWDENETKQSFHVMRRRHSLPKPDEATYFKGDEVVKYFVDRSRVVGKVERAILLKGLVPEIQKVSGNFFTYKYVEGNLLSEADVSVFVRFLDDMQARLWKPIKVKYLDRFHKACSKFYQDKTYTRLTQFREKTDVLDKKEIINGEEVPSAFTLLGKVDWEWMSDGIPCLYHGDLQPENVIVFPRKYGAYTHLTLDDKLIDPQFILLDWREDFGGIREYGDVYYDLAKIYHALIVSGEIIREGKFSISENPVEYTLEFKPNLMEFKDVLEKFILDNGYDLKKVKVLTGLIYLNIAPLHQEPYNRFLYYFGRKYLHEVLEGK